MGSSRSGDGEQCTRLLGERVQAHPLVSPTVEGRLGETLERRVPAESDESDDVLCLC